MRPSLPLSDAAELLRGATATRALRLGLAAGIAALLGAALVLALRAEEGEAPLAEPGRTTVLVVDVSSSIQPRVFRQVGDALDRAIREGGRFGVVLFSDIAYELLPPGTPAVELAGLRRYFVPVRRRPGVPTLAIGGTRFLEGPWNRVLTGGTKISTGLALARQMLDREQVADGKVVLVSDLEDEYLDLPELGRVLAGYTEIGLPLRVIGLSPTADDRRVFRRLLAESGRLEDAPTPRSEQAGAVLPPVPFPLALVVAAALLAFLLGVNERLLARFPLVDGEGDR